jgi:starch synthase
MYKDNPLFSDIKIVTSVYDDDFSEKLSDRMVEKLKMDEIDEGMLEHYKDAGHGELMKGAISFSDAVIIGSETINDDLKAHVDGLDKPVLEYKNMDEYVEAYNNFYDELLG